MKKIKSFKAVTACILSFVFILGLTVPASAESTMPSLENATAVYLYNLENDRVMCEKGANEKINPSSSAKIIAGLIAVERLSEIMPSTITITSEMLKDVSGKNIGLKAGEKVTVEDMLYAALCGGNNDAMNVIATRVAGGVSEFIAMMNKRALAIGAENTYYTNPTGLYDVRAYTTAQDTAKIALEAMKNQTYMSITSAVKYEMPKTNMASARVIYNKNSLISSHITTKYFYSLARGLNAGSSGSGSNCVVTSASKNGLTYLCIVMGATETAEIDYSCLTAKLLLQWAVNNFGYEEIVSANRAVTEIPVRLSSEVDYVSLVPKEDLRVFMNLNDKENMQVEHVLTSSALDAPVFAGDVGGFITVTVNDEVIAKVDLVAQSNVRQSKFLALMDMIKNLFLNRIVILALIVGIILTVAFFFWQYRGGRRSRGRRRIRYF